MKLSIITCTLNSEKFLEQCISSVLNQHLDLNCYEHIFIDGYSTDNTIEIIKKYQRKFKNVKLIKCDPKGVFNGMNNGIKIAKGDFIYCLNSDDYLEDNILRSYLEFVDTNKDYDIFFSKMNFVKEGKIINISNNNFIFLRKFLFNKFGCNVLVQQPTVLVKTALIKKMGYFDENKKIASDYGMWLKMLSCGVKFKFFSSCVSNFRVHIGSISSNAQNRNLQDEECKYFLKKFFPLYKYYINIILTGLLVLFIRVNKSFCGE